MENRCRFPLEVLDAIIEVWGSRKVGIKICPSDDYNDSYMSYEESSELYDYYIRQLVNRKLAFINLSRRGSYSASFQDEHFISAPRPLGLEFPAEYDVIRQFGPLIKYEGSQTLLMVNHEYTVAEAQLLIDGGKIDLVTFGRPFIYNPVRADETSQFHESLLGLFSNFTVNLGSHYTHPTWDSVRGEHSGQES